MNDFIKYIHKNKCGKYFLDVSLKKYNTYRINTKAKCLLFPSNINNLIKVIDYLKKNNLKFMILGNGSNLIFECDSYDGVVIKLDAFNEIIHENRTFKVGSGYSLMKFAYYTARLGFTGLEFATGIPGTIGGAVYMNAGAYKSDMGYVVRKIKVLTPDLKVRTLFNKDLNFHYRSSFLKENPGYIVLEVTFVLKRGDKEQILEIIKTRKEKRLATQPLEFPSAGSVFRNPKDKFAGELIEKCNLKGMNVNGAEISMKHANFIVNKGECRGSDITALINIIKKEVKEKFEEDLILEQEIIK